MPTTLKAIIGMWSDEYIYSTDSNAHFKIGNKLVTAEPLDQLVKFHWGKTVVLCNNNDVVDTCRLIYAGLNHIMD